MLFKIITVLTIVTIAKCHDVIVGLDVGGRKIFDEKRVASPAIWRQTENVTINATEGEVISRVVITDLRPEKDGAVRIVEGGEGQKSITIELKSPTVLRGFEFQIQAYADPQKNQETTVKDEVEHPSQVRNQRNTEKSSNTNYSFTTAESSSKGSDGDETTNAKENEKRTQVSSINAIYNDTSTLIPVLNNEHNNDLLTSTTEPARISQDSETHNIGTTVSSPKISTNIPTNNKDQSRYSRDTQDQPDEADNKYAINNGKPSLPPTFSVHNIQPFSDISTIRTTQKNNENKSNLPASNFYHENPTNILLNFESKTEKETMQLNDTDRTVRDIQNESTPTIPTYIKDTTEQHNKHIKTDTSRTVRDTETEEHTEEHINVPKSMIDVADQKFGNPAENSYSSETTIVPDEASTILRGLISGTDKFGSTAFAYSTEIADEKTRISRDSEDESKKSDSYEYS